MKHILTAGELHLLAETYFKEVAAGATNKHTVKRLIAHELCVLCERTPVAQYKITEKGQAHLNALQCVPLPVLEHVSPLTKLLPELQRPETQEDP